MRTLAFSLIELMVVIAIVAILAVIAVPVYSQYMIKSKIVDSVSVMQGFAREAVTHYNQYGVFPPSITINGVTIASYDPWTEVTMPGTNIFGIAYAVSADGKGLELGMSLSGLDGIPGYAEPDSGNVISQYTNTYVNVRDIDGIMVTTCGPYNSDPPSYINSYDIPAQYLPTNCNCRSQTFFELNTGC